LLISTAKIYDLFLMTSFIFSSARAGNEVTGGTCYRAARLEAAGLGSWPKRLQHMSAHN